MDGVAVESGLAGPGGVFLVVGILLFLAQAQVALHCLQRTGGEAALNSIWLPLPGDRDAYLIRYYCTLSSGCVEHFLQRGRM